MVKVLISGATGFIGSNLAKRLIKENAEVHILARGTSSLKVLGDIPVIVHRHDGTTGKMLEIFQSAKPAIVFHIAAKFVAEHQSQDVEELVKSNLLFGAQLLEAMSITNVRHLICAGTSWQHFEQESYNPVNLYAATKQAFEDLAAYYVRSGSIKMVTLKLLDTYGPNDPRQKLFALFEYISNSGERLKMSQGEQLLGLVYIDDVIEAFIAAGSLIETLPDFKILSYTLAPDHCYSLKEVAAIYEQVSGKHLNIGWGERTYRKREVMRPHIGIRLPNWKAKVSLVDGIKKCLKNN